MAVGSVQNKNMSFEEWLKTNNKESQVKQAPQARPGSVTENGVPVKLAQELHSGKSIFQVASQNPTKETAGANGASSAGVATQPSSVDNGPNQVDNVNQTDNTSVLAAGATGHTPQTQAPTLASGLTATTGNEDTGAQGGATSGQLNKDLYAQYEAAMKEAKAADNGEAVSNGEGTLTTGETDGANGANGTGGVDGASGADGANGAEGVDGATGAENPQGTDSANANDPANNAPGDNTGNNENPTDSSNDNSANIQKQEQQKQEQILDARRFRKMEEEAAA